MTQLEIFQATVAHQPHEDYLFHASFTPDLHRRVLESFNLEENADLHDFFGMYKPASVGPTAPEGYSAPDFSAYYEDIDIPENASIDGAGVLNLPGDFYHFTRKISPLRNAEKLEDIEEFPINTLEGWSEDSMAAQVSKAHEEGRATTTWVGHMYETAWQIRGYEQFLEDILLRPEWCESILDRLMERNRKMACAAARAGVDYLTTGDDVANQKALMFSPHQWRKFIKSRWSRVYEAALAIKPDIQIWYHSDGNLMAIIGELVEIGITILNPVQPECMDPVEVKALWGKDLVLDGTIGTQSTMPWSNPEGVKQVVRERMETLGGDGALILSPTHTLEPEVPIENINAFIEAAKTK